MWDWTLKPSSRLRHDLVELWRGQVEGDQVPLTLGVCSNRPVKDHLALETCQELSWNNVNRGIRLVANMPQMILADFESLETNSWHIALCGVLAMNQSRCNSIIWSRNFINYALLYNSLHLCSSFSRIFANLIAVKVILPRSTIYTWIYL